MSATPVPTSPSPPLTGATEEAPPDRRQRTSRRRRRRRLEPRVKGTLADRNATIVSSLVATTVVGSMLAVGSVHPPWIVCFSLVALAAGGFALWSQGARIAEIPAPAWVLAALAGVSVLQALPIPFSWLAVMAPRNADVWRETTQLVTQTDPSWASVSIDPGATLTEALKWLSYAAIFLAAAALGKQRGPASGIRILFGSAALASAVTLAHALAGATSLYGVYEPLQARPPWALAPLLNPNNLAGYLNLGFFCGLGLLVTAASPASRWLVGLASAVVAAVSVMSGSRGGAVALAIGAVLVAGALLLVRRRGSGHPLRSSTMLVQILGAGLGGGAFFVLGATPTVWRQLLDETSSKLRLLDQTRPLIADHLWLGVGRGAYETAFPPYRDGSRSVVFQYAENFVAQWVAEWGIVVGLAALLALAFLFRPRRLQAFHRPIATTAMVGLLAFLLQNMLDLGLELLSIGLALATLLGTLWGAASRSQRSSGHSISPSVPELDGRFDGRRGRAWTALTVAGVLLALAMLRWDMHPIVTERHQLQQRFNEARARGSDALRSFRPRLHGALMAHPGDPYLPILEALVARDLAENSLPWVGRAIERDPSAGRPHLLLAKTLAARGARRQSLLAARMAVERDPALVTRCALLVARIASSPEEALAAAPATEAGTKVLIAIAKQLPLENGHLDPFRLLERALSRDPGNPELQEALAQTFIRAARARPPEGPCRTTLTGCLHTAESLLKDVQRLSPERESVPLLRAELLLVAGQPGSAEDLLARTCNENVTSARCWTLRVQAAAAANRPDALVEAEEGLLTAACTDRERCIAAARTLARIRRSRGEWTASMNHFLHAARESDAAHDWLAAAEMAAQAGHLGAAEKGIHRARLLGAKPPPKLEDRVKTLRRNLLLRHPSSGRSRTP